MDRPRCERWPRPELDEYLIETLVEIFMPPSAPTLAAEAGDLCEAVRSMVSPAAWKRALAWEAAINARGAEVSDANLQVGYLLGLAAGAALYCQTEEAEARLVGERVAAAVLLGPVPSYSASEAGDRAAGAMRSIARGDPTDDLGPGRDLE